MWVAAINVTLRVGSCNGAGRATTASTDEAKAEIADEQNRNSDEHDDLHGVVARTAEQARR
jgi:hypothetical protein